METRHKVLMGVDVGTTHCKAGLFVEQKGRLKLVADSGRPTNSREAPEGYAYYDPQELWETVVSCIAEVLVVGGSQQPLAVGISSMAETGLVVDQESGLPKSVLLPWFDPCAAPQAEILAKQEDLSHRKKRFLASGIYPSFKCSLAKILWLRDRQPSIMDGAVWLPAASFIAYQLSGNMACDFSLAGRTYAFHIGHQRWDEEWLREWDLSTDHFPIAVQAGTPIGVSRAGVIPGLQAGIPISVTGHDHVSAAFAVGAIHPGLVFDSMGTAESFLGTHETSVLGDAEFNSGLSYGMHVMPSRSYWMGGLSASGGSVEWLRSLLGEQPLSYQEIEALLEKAGLEPSGILYFPYLTGSGSPHTNPDLRGSLVGLSSRHGRADLLKAVLEGTAYELEYIRRTAEVSMGIPIRRILAAGGGTRNKHWLQIKADVFGCPVDVLSMPEATVLGAALLAGLGTGLFDGEESALRARPEMEVAGYTPASQRHETYKHLFEEGYLALQQPLRDMARKRIYPR
jgi:sugar (pentulose or hexulose) kinase